jgi:hypothetical protein
MENPGEETSRQSLVGCLGAIIDNAGRGYIELCQTRRVSSALYYLERVQWAKFVEEENGREGDNDTDGAPVHG